MRVEWDARRARRYVVGAVQRRAFRARARFSSAMRDGGLAVASSSVLRTALPACPKTYAGPPLCPEKRERMPLQIAPVSSLACPNRS